jgi:hypothetical protein
MAGCSEVLDDLSPDGDETKEALLAREQLPAPAPRPLIAAALQRELDLPGLTGDVEVDVFLADDVGGAPAPDETGSGTLIDGIESEVMLNGVRVGSADVERHVAEMLERARVAEGARRRAYAARWSALAARYGLGNRFDLLVASGSASATVKLPRSVLRRVGVDRGAGLVSHVAPAEKGIDLMTSALSSVELSTVAFPAGWNGTNIGVWMNDGAGRPDGATACVDDADLIVEDYGSEPKEEHATKTLCTLMAAAPEAKVHYAVPTESCYLRGDVATFTNPPVLVSSLSASWESTGINYTRCVREWDNFVYNTNIAHFAAAGNNDDGTFAVIGSAKAYNVFAIGAYADEASPDAIAPFSSFADPLTTADKPDFVAPGVDIDVGNWTGLSGTSFAAPLAAGFAADLLERRSFLRMRPALLKAFLLVNSVRVDGPGPFGDKDGAGRLDFSNTGSGRWYWWSGANGSFFADDRDGDSKLEIVVTYPLVAGATYQVAISWLVLGTYVETNLEPNMDLDLQVVAPNGSQWQSQSFRQNYEMVRFVAPVAGDYSFRIERFTNSGQGDVRLGMVIRRR